MNKLINDYITSKELAWSASTIRSEHYRLASISKVLDGNPANLWGLLIKKYSPYSRVIIWTRVVEFWKYLLNEGHREGKNNYELYRKRNARLFKNAYTTRAPGITFRSALDKLDQIRDSSSKEKARELLSTGMRFTESLATKDGRITGKGGKVRRLYGSDRSSRYKYSYATFRRHLGSVGLKPHDLRKIFLNRLVEVGANEFELCEVAGWNDLNTARSYIKADDKKIKELVKKCLST